jgi:hypothetical protein
VQELLHSVVRRLLERGRVHDDTKFEEPEFSSFAEVSAQLNEVEYGSDRYEELLAELDSALEHHYEYHRHHPEHWEEGIGGMTLLDIVEMIVDWKAASERHEDGDIRESINKNQDRFGYSDELAGLLRRTADQLFEE